MRHATALAQLLGLCVVVQSTVAGAGALVGNHRPRIEVETALIQWNPTTRVQHLIVAARFTDIEGPFAWWLPVPNDVDVRPLGIVDGDVRIAFSILLAAYRSRTPRWELPLLPNGQPRDDFAFGGQGDVDVHVFDISSEAAILDVLKRAGKHRDAALLDYLDRYGKAKHHLVCVRADPGNPTWTTPYIHLRFETDQPWYPYREPAYPSGLHDPGQHERLLRLYVLSTEQVAMQHGRSEPTMAYAWLAFEPKHEEVRAAFGTMAEVMAVEDEPRLWMTSFEDRHAVRPGDDDLMFASAGTIPKQGSPGTVNDRSGAGIRFRPVDAPRAEVLSDRKHGLDRKTKDATGPNASLRLPQSAVGRRVGPAWVFGVMVMLSLAIAGWLARDSQKNWQKNRQKNRQETAGRKKGPSQA